jgi:hypothetical protein
VIVTEGPGRGEPWACDTTEDDSGNQNTRRWHRAYFAVRGDARRCGQSAVNVRGGVIMKAVLLRMGDDGSYYPMGTYVRRDP